MAEYYAPKARAEAEAVEAAVWAILKVATLTDGRPRFADNTIKWANINEHPKTGKFGVILPDDWRELGVDIAEVNIQTHEEMEAAGWFPSDDEL